MPVSRNKGKLCDAQVPVQLGVEIVLIHLDEGVFEEPGLRDGWQARAGSIGGGRHPETGCIVLRIDCTGELAVTGLAWKQDTAFTPTRSALHVAGKPDREGIAGLHQKLEAATLLPIIISSVTEITVPPHDIARGAQRGDVPDGNVDGDGAMNEVVIADLEQGVAGKIAEFGRA